MTSWLANEAAFYLSVIIVSSSRVPLIHEASRERIIGVAIKESSAKSDI